MLTYQSPELPKLPPPVTIAEAQMIEIAPVEEITTPVPEPIKRIETLEERIGRRAAELGYDPTKAQAIAWSESRFNPNAKNSSSTASGIYQFLNGTFKEYCIKRYSFAVSMDQKNDPEIQIECALKILTESPRGEDHWWPSRPFWQYYPGQR